MEEKPAVAAAVTDHTMRKISLAVTAFYISILTAFAQVSAENDSSSYKVKKLKLEEINFVSSYYNQDGNNAAVTGGIGTEKLRDISNSIELRFAGSDVKNRQRLLSFSLGVDSYTSASSDNIDPSTISSASSSETRYYPSVSYAIKNKLRRNMIGFSGYYSKEYDYNSVAPGFTFVKYSKDNNKEFTVKIQSFFDKREIILPIELRNDPAVFTGTTQRNSHNLSLVYSGVVNQRMHVAALMDLVYQQGLLSTPFNRVNLSNGVTSIENLPSSRIKFPLGIRMNYFLSDFVVIRSFYRFYFDTWNLKAHTFNLETSFKLTPFFSLAPVYRFYMQTAADYFAASGQHHLNEEFFTSDYDLSRFSSHLIGLNLRKVSREGLLGFKKWNSFEVRYSYYYRSTQLNAHSIALALKFR
jgi:hypothetical protein